MKIQSVDSPNSIIDKKKERFTNSDSFENENSDVLVSAVIGLFVRSSCHILQQSEYCTKRWRKSHVVTLQAKKDFMFRH